MSSAVLLDCSGVPNSALPLAAADRFPVDCSGVDGTTRREGAEDADVLVVAVAPAPASAVRTDDADTAVLSGVAGCVAGTDTAPNARVASGTGAPTPLLSPTADSGLGGGGVAARVGVAAEKR